MNNRSGIDRELASRLGNRHLGAEPGSSLASVNSNEWHTVRLTASPAVAETVGGQHAIWMLANLLARQFAVIQEVELVLPRVPLQAGVALFGAAGNLPTSIEHTIRMVAGPAMMVRVAEDLQRVVDIEVTVGATGELGMAKQHIGILGSGWNLYAGDSKKMPGAMPVGRNPFGPYFAACVAAGEVFKYLAGLRPGAGSYVDELCMSLWDYQKHADWKNLPSGEWPVALELPPFYLIGAGAVGQAMGAALIASGHLRGYVTVMDDDHIDGTNLNRYPLATQNDEGQIKSELLARNLRDGGFEVYSYNKRWPDYAYDQERPPQRDDLRGNEAEYRYGLVLSCVDKNSQRHAIQNFWPEFLMGGSTPGMGLAVAAYDMRSEYECLKCYNRPEPKDPTIEAIASELRTLAPEECKLQAEQRGVDWQLIEQYLANPRCGTLGEQEITKFYNAARDREWSVGFASVASGTLLAAQLVKYALKGREAFKDGSTLRFIFTNPAPRWSKHRRSPECECNTTGRAAYEALWAR